MSDIDIIRAIKEKNNLQFIDQSKNTSKHLCGSLINIQIFNHIKLTSKFKM